QGRNYPPLRCSARGVNHLAVSVQHSGFEPLLDQPQQALVSDSQGQQLDQTLVIDVVKEPLISASTTKLYRPNWCLTVNLWTASSAPLFVDTHSYIAGSPARRWLPVSA